MSESSDDDERAAESKFELGRSAEFESGELPWGYGDCRVTAMARDPEAAYLYWEMTDEGIAAARERLGAAGPDGWCNLRVYDTTGRVFDGTNANDYFDVRVDRNDREYFLMIRRPTSTMHVEVGIKTAEGFFQPVARSGPAEFPRNAPSPHTALEWMTVTSDDAPPAAEPYHSRYAGPEHGLPARAGAGYVDVWRAAYAPSMPSDPEHPYENASSSGSGVHRTLERSAHIERWWHLDEWRSEWRGGLRFTRRLVSIDDPSYHWHEGPIPTHLFDPERIAMELLGERPVVLHSDGVAFTVYGPWRVTIRGLESEHQRRVLSTWTMRWVRAETPMMERWGHAVERTVLSRYRRGELLIGSSEGVLEQGSSERWRIGASERMWLGASEWVAAGGSETGFIGSSRWGFAGASAFAYMGSSERLGGSERVGASEIWRAGGGASPLGASETHYSQGERWGGRLEEV